MLVCCCCFLFRFILNLIECFFASNSVKRKSLSKVSMKSDSFISLVVNVYSTDWNINSLLSTPMYGYT